MNADLLRIRNSKLFKKLPDRAFDRIVSLIKVRAFESADEILNFEKESEFSQSYGYVVQGQVLFVDADSKPVGLAIKDEFFLGRPFSLNETSIVRLLSAHESTFVVFVPRDVIRLLAQASEAFSDMVEDIYDSIFDRAKLVQSDVKAHAKVQHWLKEPASLEEMAAWGAQIEKRRSETLLQKEQNKKARQKMRLLWAFGLSLCFVFFLESMLRILDWNFSFVYFVDPNWKVDAYKPGSQFNIVMGIIGSVLLLLTSAHSVLKWGIQEKGWKFNHQFSQELHMFLGFLGFIFILLHSAFHLVGNHVANYAIDALLIVVGSGIVGQFLSNQIPKTIQGGMLKLDQLKEEQDKLREKATLLMNDQAMYRTSIVLLSRQEPKSAFESIIMAPVYWMRARKLRQSLEALGLASENAKLASQYVMEEVGLHRKIKFLKISDIFFQRWMMVHKPIGYIFYALAMIHIIAVTVLK